MKARRGTKLNPFEIGELVCTRSGARKLLSITFEGTVLRISNASVGESYTGDREWSPIMYFVDFGDHTEWLESRYLEASEYKYSDDCCTEDEFQEEKEKIFGKKGDFDAL